MDSSKIRLIIIAVLAVFAALYLGISAATAQFETIAWVLGASGFLVCLLLGRRIWLLIPFLGAVNLTLMAPGQPTTILLAEVLVVGFSMLMLSTRKLPFALQFTEMEWWCVLLTICVLQVYMRHPVGVRVFGGAQIGGRPYILFAAAACAALILCGLKVPANELKTAMKLAIIGGFINVVVGAIGMLVPKIGYWFGGALAAADPKDGNSAEVDPGEAGRIKFIVFIPLTLANWVSSVRNPLLACFSIRWAPLVLLSFALASLSGYRNVVAAVGLTYLVGIFYRGGVVALMGSFAASALGLAMLAAVNQISPLPPNVQRALSFLPGTWDQRYRRDSESSNDWRLEMWREALFTDRWIANKFLGDGLGFSAHELDIQQRLEEYGNTGLIGAKGLDMYREYVMATGGYHSGPVSAVRTIGYFGLLVMALAQLRLAVHAHRQIKRCQGTEWYPVALFFGIPIIWNPVFFWLIFGGFGGDAPFILLSAGMLRMLENNLPLPAYAPAGKLVSIPVGTGHRALAAR